MTPVPHLKEASQVAGENPGVRKFQRKLLMNFKADFFVGHPVVLRIPTYNCPKEIPSYLY